MKKAKKATKAKASKATEWPPEWGDIMTGAALKSGIEKLYGNEQSQSAFARLMGVGDRTIRSYISEEFPVPKPIGFLVALMLKTKTGPEDLKI